MFKHYFEGIQNIELAPIISLVIFFVFFVLVVFLIFKIDKPFLDHMKNLPMDDGSTSTNNPKSE